MKLFGSNGKKNRNSDRRRDENEAPESRLISFEDTDAEDELYSQEPADEADIEFAISEYKQKKGRRRRTVFGIVCLVAVVLFVAYNIWSQPPPVNTDGLGANKPTETPAPTPDAPETSGEPISDDPEVTSTIDPNENRNMQAYTFVLFGSDAANSLTDTIMVGKFDTRNHTLNIVSIPRDTLVSVPWSSKKINTIFTTSGGIDHIEDEDGFLDGIQDVLGFRVDFWAYVDLNAFVQVVDAIGGVYYDVPVDMNYHDPDQNLNINISKGYQWLSGEEALKVVRFRSGYATGDLGRIETQQDFLKSVAKQILQLDNILSNLGELSKIFVENVQVNLTAGNIMFFGQEFFEISSENITFHTLPYTYPTGYDGYIRGGSYILVDIEPWLEIVNEYVNPYYEDVTESDVNILRWNPSTQTATSTQGDTYSITEFDDYSKY